MIKMLSDDKKIQKAHLILFVGGMQPFNFV